VEHCLEGLVDYVGANKILWATDYPRPDGFFPGAPTMVRKLIAGAPAKTVRQVMVGGAKGFYGLH
jgi:predicted TIM-barrel fold metal-dependent hydrolase